MRDAATTIVQAILVVTSTLECAVAGIVATIATMPAEAPEAVVIVLPKLLAVLTTHPLVAMADTASATVLTDSMEGSAAAAMAMETLTTVDVTISLAVTSTAVATVVTSVVETLAAATSAEVTVPSEATVLAKVAESVRVAIPVVETIR